MKNHSDTVVFAFVLFILFIAAYTSGCASGGEYPVDMPAFPRSHHYAIQIQGKPLPLSLFSSAEDVRSVAPMSGNEVVRCLKFEIISVDPYKLKYVGQVDLEVCNGLSGYTSDDILKVTNWIEDMNRWGLDVYDWAKKQLERRCLPQ